MARADSIYADPSALGVLYLHQPRSREMAAWRFRTQGSLPVTHHGRAEIINAVALALFRGEITEQNAMQAFDHLGDDFEQGHLILAPLLWRAALNRAEGLSKSHTARFGTRASDVLHVACALELKLPHFLTFDERQAKLAKAAGLRLVRT